MTLSDISIKNPVFAWMLLLGICFFGLISFGDLGVSQMPDVEFPVLTIDVSWEGAAPEVMETDVVDPIEDAVMGVQNLREVSSATYQGNATITLEFDLDRDIDAALQDVQSKISGVQKRLPEDVDPPVITKTSSEDAPIMFISFGTSTRSLRELMEYADKNIIDRFKTISGVGDVFRGGFLERNLRVWLNKEALDKYELTAKDIVDAIEKEHVEVPAGRLETDEKESNIRVMGEAYTVEDFENIVINNRSGQPNYKPIRLKEVAKVSDDLEDVRRMARTNGMRAVGLGIRKQRGTNAVEVAHKVKAQVEAIKKYLPKDYGIWIRFDSTRFIENSVHELVRTLVLACLLTAVVCWCFLGSFNSTANVLFSIPMSVLGTFMAIKFSNFTLNTFTLLGLSLSVGIIVDDAIMVIENIVRHREMKESRLDAAQKGARQITFAAIAATLAIIAIFLPVAFMKGIIGKFFYQYAITITAAVALSLISALTITPTFSSQTLDVGERRTRLGKFFENSILKMRSLYEKYLAVALTHRKRVLVISTLIFIASLFVFGLLRKEFVPAQDQSIFMVRFQTPIGSSMAYTDGRIKECETILMSRPEIEGYVAIIGGFSGGQVNTGAMFVSMKQPQDRPRDKKLRKRWSQEDMMNFCRTEFNKVKDMKATMQDLSMRGFAATRGFPIEFTVRGHDWEKLVATSTKIQEEMKKSDLFTDVDTDYLEGMPEVRIFPDRTKALERGVSVEKITDVVNTMMGGKRAGKYTKGGKRYDVRVKITPEENVSAADIEKLYVWNNRGERVQLKDVVTIIEKPSLLSITRRDRERAIGIFANPAPGKSLGKALEKVEEIARRTLPEGCHMVLSGTSQTFKESFASLIFALWCGIIIAYMILASQFNHVVHPFTVLLALPFSITGAVLALFIGNQSVNIYSMIGIILLFGIVKKNSILLVEFTNQVRHEGKSALEALKIACPIRLRPIVMTSFTTIAGAIPAALALGAGAETIRPMGVAIIGGVLVSTFLTLFVVPSAYLLFTKFDTVEGRRNVVDRLKRFFGKIGLFAWIQVIKRKH